MYNEWKAHRPGAVRGTRWLLHVLSGILLTLCLASPAAAESGALFVFPYEGFRFEAPADMRVLTQHNLAGHADFLAGLGTDEAAVLAAMYADNVVLEAYPAEGGQLELAIAPADGTLADLLADYSNMLRYREVAISAGNPDWMRMVFSQQQGGLPVFTLRYITVAHGQQFLLSSVLIGREPDEADDAQVLGIIGRISFLSARTTPEPTATPEPTPEPTSTPKPTPGVAKLLRNEPNEDVHLAVDPPPAWIDSATLTVTGTTEARAAVRLLAGETSLNTSRADAGGSFSLTGDLPESGDYQITVEAALGGSIAAETFAVRLDAPKLWLTVTEPLEPIRRKEALVRGKTEPGARIDIRGGGLVINVRATAGGDFHFRVKLSREGEYTYALTASLKGFETYETVCTVVREYSYAEALAAFRQSMISVDYNRLCKEPEVYIDKRVSYRVRVAAVGDVDGEPCMLLETRAQSGKWDRLMWALCEEAPPYAAGEVFTAYLQITGGLVPYTDTQGARIDVPVTRLRFHGK